MVIVVDRAVSDCSCRDCSCPVLGPIGTLCEGCQEAGCDVFYTDCRCKPPEPPEPSGELDESAESSM